jgi:hypothetical protein
MSETVIVSDVLSRDDIEQFQAHGYHIHGKLFTDDEVQAIRDACEQVLVGAYETGTPPDDIYWRPGDSPQAMRKIDNAWKANRTIARAVTDERLGHIAAQLIGAPSIRLWQDQISFKPGSGGKVVTWHQDWAYWQMIAECQTVTCWIALDDVHPDSGPMMFLEGSQSLGLYQRPSTISGDDQMKPGLPDGTKMREVPVVIPAGHVSFHHGLMLHGSDANRTGQPRRAMVSHVFSGVCTYRERNEHVNERAMRQYTDYPKNGERFHGPQFPQMWPPVS